jgi:hypothetical protein
MECLLHLKQLYANWNRLSSLAELPTLPDLHILSVSGNAIASFDGMAAQVSVCWHLHAQAPFLFLSRTFQIPLVLAAPPGGASHGRQRHRLPRGPPTPSTPRMPPVRDEHAKWTLATSNRAPPRLRPPAVRLPPRLCAWARLRRTAAVARSKARAERLRMGKRERAGAHSPAGVCGERASGGGSERRSTSLRTRAPKASAGACSYERLRSFQRAPGTSAGARSYVRRRPLIARAHTGLG